MLARHYEHGFRAERTRAGRDRARARLLGRFAEAAFRRAGVPIEALSGTRLGLSEPLTDDCERSIEDELPRGESALVLAHRIGQLLDRTRAWDAELARGEPARERKRRGSYFTPPEVARRVVEAAWPSVARPLPTICDPAVGGGAFLLEAAELCVRSLKADGVSEEEAFERVHGALHGVDVSELAIAVAEVALLLHRRGVGLKKPPSLRVGDALFDASSEASVRPPTGVRGFDFRAFEGAWSGFDWIVGNPPWVAYQGRAAEPLPSAVRGYYRARYASFAGYPTLQSLFVERAAELAPRGVIALLVPSSLSDLDGYAATRRRLTTTHRVLEPLEEFGQDAFEGVVQPCFGLVARASDEASASAAPFRLAERAARDREARVASPPDVLVRLAALPPLPAAIFGELGFQTNREVSARLLDRREAASGRDRDPLFEGKNVREFVVGEPRLWLELDRALLTRTRCLLRPLESYDRVAFVVRQTAAYPVAAPWRGGRFRNSLLAGYANEEFDVDLLVGLLNSRLYRALHVAGQRDARQITFPQVKVSHLRKLPAPPANSSRRSDVRRYALELRRERSSGDAGTEVARAALDRSVYELFGLSAAEQGEIEAFLAARAPSALTFLGSRTRVS